MKPGSLVECIISFTDKPYGESLPEKGIIYTVRDVFEEEPGIRLEEIVNPPHYYKHNGHVFFEETYFDARHFRELQPPMTVSFESLIEEEVAD